MSTAIQSPIRANVYAVQSEDDSGYEIEAVLFPLEVERADDDEVAIHAIERPDQAEVSLYLSRAEAMALAHTLIVKALQTDVE